jgi:hypothetical protein
VHTNFRGDYDSGDALLDLTTPDIPLLIEAGFYIARVYCVNNGSSNTGKRVTLSLYFRVNAGTNDGIQQTRVPLGVNEATHGTITGIYKSTSANEPMYFYGSHDATVNVAGWNAYMSIMKMG